ncbi:MAG: 5-oxoprolinase subunit PxpA [Chitinophagales bacterium]
MLIVDLNADLGEGMPFDEFLMPLISSANIACGGHTGNISSMELSIGLAKKNGVAIGAHPSYPDKENFGRVDLLQAGLQLSALEESLVTQIMQLQMLCAQSGVSIHHVKPHGALYNRAALDPKAASCICSAVKKIDSGIIIYGMSQSVLAEQAALAQLSFVHEAFADRVYQDERTLRPRTKANAVINDIQAAVNQAMQLAKEGKAFSAEGNTILVKAETICIHGDHPNALAIARAIHDAFKENGIRLQAP